VHVVQEEAAARFELPLAVGELRGPFQVTLVSCAAAAPANDKTALMAAQAACVFVVISVPREWS
jgi:hypothetical protein